MKTRNLVLSALAGMVLVLPGLSASADPGSNAAQPVKSGKVGIEARSAGLDKKEVKKTASGKLSPAEAAKLNADEAKLAADKAAATASGGGLDKGERAALHKEFHQIKREYKKDLHSK